MDTKVLTKMRSDWNDRAKENAQYYVQNAAKDWDQREFFRTGEINVANDVLPDMHTICGGQRSPLDLTALEIGCGVGRMTRMLSRVFGHVTGVDISEEMIARARQNTADLGNVDLMVGDGCTLTGLADASCDYAFSFIVFQHIPSYDVIASYCREVFRVLKPGSLFKFQVQGGDGVIRKSELDTWLGYPFSPESAAGLAKESGFALEAQAGAGTQYFWLWFRKPGVPAIPESKP
jgi:ubiquinone/menaquinone biosynthesis C-methylase UbiE